jgi:hypothetical protein
VPGIEGATAIREPPRVFTIHRGETKTGAGFAAAIHTGLIMGHRHEGTAGIFRMCLKAKRRFGKEKCDPKIGQAAESYPRQAILSFQFVTEDQKSVSNNAQEWERLLAL